MKRALLLLAIGITGFGIRAQNNCGGANVFSADVQLNTQYCFNSATITTAIGTPTPCNNAVNDVWYTFTISSGPYNITITAENYASSGGPNARNVNFEVYSGPCGGLSSIACASTGGDGAAESLDLANLANGTYYVRFYSDINGTIPSIDLCITATAASTPPANDDCAGAIPVAVGANGICTEVTGSNTGATDSSLPDPSCAFYSGGDVWYSVTVPSSGNITFASDYAASNSIDDVGMAIYTGTCGSLTEVDCDDDSGIGFMASISASGLTPGSTVYVRVWQDFGGLEGDFDLCFSEPLPSLSNQDCVDSQGLCTDATLNGASDGSGSVIDLDLSNQGCLSSGENEVNWYNLEISVAGDFAFTLSPDNGTDDYDFAVWVYPGGVGQGCPPGTQPDRCSYGGGEGLNNSYDTGLGQGAVDVSENASGDNWVSTIPVNAGDVIVMVIDNFSTTTSPFTLDFTGTAGLDCSVLPVEVVTFYAQPMERGNRIHWKTVSELMNDYFTLQYSLDGKNWQTLTTVDGQGTKNGLTEYFVDHTDLIDGTIYYKLYQTDFDGKTSTPRIISMNAEKVQNRLIKTVNTMGQEVDSTFNGLVIDIYADGTSKKRFQ